MDPDTNLEEQREYIKEIFEECDKDKPNKDIIAGFAVRLAELQQGLDEWVSKGGFLPAAWQGDAATAINRFSSHPDTCFCNGGPHRRSMGCM